MSGENAAEETAAEGLAETPSSGSAEATAESAVSQTEAQVKRGPGRPRLSDEEKAKRAAERAARKMQEAQTLAAVVEAHPPATPVPAKAEPVKPSKEQIAKAEHAIEVTWGTLEALILALGCKDIPGVKPPEPDDKRAKDVGAAWGELLAEALPNADMTIRITVASISTAACAGGVALAIKKHNSQAKETKK